MKERTWLKNDGMMGAFLTSWGSLKIYEGLDGDGVESPEGCADEDDALRS